MFSKIRNCKMSLLISFLTLSFTILITSVYSGHNEGYNNIFILMTIIAPILIMLFSKDSIHIDIGFSAFVISMILLYAMIFWWYMDRPPSNIVDITKAPEELRGGWFSFENHLRIELLLGCSIISMAVTSIIKLLLKKRNHLFK